MNKIINDASINEWFSQQMASLTGQGYCTARRLRLDGA